MKAIWSPVFYGDDQPLAVGRQHNFAFFRKAPVHLPYCGERVFYTGNIVPEQMYWMDATIINITHPLLGEVNEVINLGCEYIFVLADGTRLMIDVEENPGKIINVEGQWLPEFNKVKANEWIMQVELQKT